MKGIVIDPGKAPEICKLPNDSQGLERWLGGPMRVDRFPTQPVGLAYATKALGPLPASWAHCATRIWRGNAYYGRLLLLGWHGSAPTDIPKALIEDLVKQWSAMEVKTK